MTIQAHSKSSVGTLTALVHPNGNLSDLLFVNMVLRHHTAHPAVVIRGLFCLLYKQHNIGGKGAVWCDGR